MEKNDVAFVIFSALRFIALDRLLLSSSSPVNLYEVVRIRRQILIVFTAPCLRYRAAQPTMFLIGLRLRKLAFCVSLVVHSSSSGTRPLCCKACRFWLRIVKVPCEEVVCIAFPQIISLYEVGLYHRDETITGWRENITLPILKTFSKAPQLSKKN